jgi:hypothetical protein
MLELYNSAGTRLSANDDWMNSPDRAEIESRGLAPEDSREAVIFHTLDPGAYTAVVRGKNNGTGIGLVEAYDLQLTNNSQFANLSTRGFVETGDNVLIGGFIAGNRNGSITALVRALGPSLPATVPNRLSNPILELHNENGATLAMNDNWEDSQKAAIQQTGIPPTDARESAIYISLAPGAYTAIVRGVNSTGNGLVEVYSIP